MIDLFSFPVCFSFLVLLWLFVFAIQYIVDVCSIAFYFRFLSAVPKGHDIYTVFVFVNSVDHFA